MINYSKNTLPQGEKNSEFINYNIKDYIFSKTIIITEKDIDANKYITFENCQFIKTLKLNKIDTPIDFQGISFRYCSFFEKVSLNSIFENFPDEKIKEIRFENCVFKKGLGNEENLYNRLKFKSFFIEDSFAQNFEFSWNYEIDFLSLANVCGNYDIQSICRKISITFNDKLADLYERLYHKKLYLNDWDSFLLEDKNLRVNPDNNIELSIYQFFEKKVTTRDVALMNIDLWIDFNSSENQTGNVTVDGIYNKLAIYGRVESLTLSRIFAQTINLHGISSSQEIQFENINALVKDSTFIMSSSNFNNALFFNVDFKSFKYFSIYKCNLESTFFSQCTFNEKIHSFDIDNMKRVDNHAKYESYKQLKSALLKSNNTPVALKMHSKMYSNYFKTKEASFSDKIILLFNRLSNKHGISWSRGILFVLFCGLIGFAAYKNQLSIEIIGFSKNIKYYLFFLNPTHRFDFMKEFNPTDWAYIIDFISRIFIGYGYFQTVQAFRKFGKL